MTNITMRVEGNKLILEVDLTKEFGLTSSQKSIKVASTDGNVAVPKTQRKEAAFLPC